MKLAAPSPDGSAATWRCGVVAIVVVNSSSYAPQLTRISLGGSNSSPASLMKPYLITTGILFAAITVAHAYGAIARGHIHHTDLLVLVSAGLSFWAWRLLRTAAA